MPTPERLSQPIPEAIARFPTFHIVGFFMLPNDPIGSRIPPTMLASDMISLIVPPGENWSWLNLWVYQSQ